MIKLKGLLFGALLLFAGSVSAEITLPAVIGDNMVLQRESVVPLWGKAAAGAQLTIVTSWDEKEYKAEAGAGGEWRVQVQTPAAGGPYEIRISEQGSAERTLSNVLIGEVWLCSGQSNMEMPLRGNRNQPILHSNDILMEANEPELRLFKVERQASNTELDDVNASWEESTVATAREFSAAGYQFGKKLQEILGVPVGIIQSSWGGTPIESWIDPTSISKVPDLALPMPSATVEADRKIATCLYNGMIAPLAGYGIKGFLWYQGEGNRSRPETYAQAMEALVSGWRKHWDNDELPFYYVQIAPYIYGTQAELVPFLREAQQKAEALIPLSGMVVSMDVGSNETIHPPNKTAIAKRLLYLALNETYGMEGIVCRGPVYRSMEVKDNEVLIEFDNAEFGLSSFDEPLISFEVAGADRHFYPAEAKIVSEGVLVTSDQVNAPVAVRYAFKDRAVGHLYNTAGLPAAPFRTDDWPAPDSE